MKKETFAEQKEKEPKPEKIVLFIRHPSVKWLDMLLEKAEAEKQDIEIHVPVDAEGLKMARLLADYLKKDLPQIFEKGDLNKEFTIYTSPIKRAKSEAEIVTENLKLAHTDNPEIPIPKNNEPIEVDYFSEIPWTGKKEEALKLVDEAGKKGVHPVELWFKKEPKKIIDRLNDSLPKIEMGLKLLEKSDTPVNIVFSHRLSMGLTLWLIEQKQLGRKKLKVGKNDFTRIMELTGKIAHTSISETRLQETKKGKKWVIDSIAKTPHLKKEPEYKKGVF